MSLQQSKRNQIFEIFSINDNKKNGKRYIICNTGLIWVKLVDLSQPNRE